MPLLDASQAGNMCCCHKQGLCQTTVSLKQQHDGSRHLVGFPQSKQHLLSAAGNAAKHKQILHPGDLLQDTSYWLKEHSWAKNVGLDELTITDS